MNIIVLTQEDGFFIPKNIDKIIRDSNVIEVISIDNKGSLNNKTKDFIKWFGIAQVLKMAMYVYYRKFMNLIDTISGYRLMKGLCSIKAIASKNKIAFQQVKNVNDSFLFEYIKKLKPDLIISFSAPQVIKEPLLSYPKFGIINVHGSLLPDYRGLLPSFWYLFNNEDWGGATVHYMSGKIDDGDILLQERISLKGCKTMFDIMKRTKELGGKLILQTIKLIEQNNVKPYPNIASEGRYFSWPTIQETSIFRKSGKRLI